MRSILRKGLINNQPLLLLYTQGWLASTWHLHSSRWQTWKGNSPQRSIEGALLKIFIKDLSTFLMLSWAWNCTFFMLSGPWNKAEPFWLFQAPEIVKICQFQGPQWVKKALLYFRSLKASKRCNFRPRKSSMSVSFWNFEVKLLWLGHFVVVRKKIVEKWIELYQSQKFNLKFQNEADIEDFLGLKLHLFEAFRLLKCSRAFLTSCLTCSL